jgi:hypothetical protein
MSNGIGASFVLESEVGAALATDTLDKNRGRKLDSKAFELTIYVTFNGFKCLILMGTDRSVKLRCCSQIDVTYLSITFRGDTLYLEVCEVATCHMRHYSYLTL